MTDREKLIYKLVNAFCESDDNYGCPNTGQVADHLIANGVVVREKGEWIDKSTGAYGRRQSWCSACGKHSGIGGIESNRHKAFCPNCGADMRKGEDDG